MPQNIYVFETRQVNYLDSYLNKAKSLGFNVTLTDNSHLANNKLFEEFLGVYKHYGVNTPEFEIACFARYFAMASLTKNNETFLLTDTDVYITPRFKEVQAVNYKGTFIGSEGFNAAGSEGQISPHCTFWDKELLMDFLKFLIDTYKRNNENDFIAGYYRSQQEKLGETSISDMNLLYLWKNENNIPFINSNSTKFELGIDHNISSLICEDDEFVSFAGRKFLRKRDDNITCLLKSGKRQQMALLHFQGVYKPILQRFYQGKYPKFVYYSIRNNYRQKKRKQENN